jgi:nicotinamidase-related amidase
MKKLSKLLLLVLISINGINVSAQSESTEGIKPALLVIDIQNLYIDWMDQSSIDQPIWTINNAISLFNNQKLPIIYVYHQDKKLGPPSDAKEFQFVEQIPVPEDAIKVVKNYGNSFNKTELDKKLKELGCNTVFLCGLSATGCVMATQIGALDLDYNVFMIKDATMSQDFEKTKVMEEILSVISLKALNLMLLNLK